MKKIVLPSLLFCCLGTASAQAITWGTPVTVAPMSYGNTFPRVSLVTGDRPLVTWGSGSKVYSSTWTGASFATPITITPTGVMPYIQSWTGAESDASGDTVFVTFGTSPITSGIVYSVRSVNGGASFEDTVRVTTLGPGQARFPSVSVAQGGNPVIEFMEFGPGPGFADPEHAVTRSLTGGASYLSPVEVSTIAPGEVCDCCPGAMVTDGNRHVALYRNAGSNIRTMYAATSTDGSATFPQETEVDLTHWIIVSCPSSGPAGVIVGDTLISTWMSASKVYIGTMNINDQQVGFNKLVFTGGGASAKNFPRIAAKGDTVAVVWQGNVGGIPEIYISTSVTGAAGIGTYVDTITAGYAGAQARPDVEFNNGKLHITYSDANDDVVKYLTGTVGGPVGVSENKNANALQLLSARWNNGNMELVIASPNEMDAQVQIVSTEGKQTGTGTLHLAAGKNNYAIPCQAGTGLHTVQLLGKNGSKCSMKVMVVR